MNARNPLFNVDHGVSAYEKVAVASIGSYELAEGRAIELIGQCEKLAKGVAQRMGVEDYRSILIGALQGQIKALCLEADAAGLPPTAHSEVTVKGDGGMEYTARYSADDYGDIEIHEVYTTGNVWGCLDDDTVSVISDEVVRLHLKYLREDADEAVIAAGRARMDALDGLPGRNEP